jgi:hypothetical protein
MSSGKHASIWILCLTDTVGEHQITKCWIFKRRINESWITEHRKLPNMNVRERRILQNVENPPPFTTNHYQGNVINY